MKKVTLFLMIITLFTACNQNKTKVENNETSNVETAINADPSVVYVYYFHGKQRCKTCVAVGDIAKETIENTYAENDKVIFTVINTTDKEFEALCEKYEVTWNALIIAKGEDFVEITDQAFATAVGNPEALENLIKEEVNKKIVIRN